MTSPDYKKAWVTAAYAVALVDYVHECGLDPASLYAENHLASLQTIQNGGQITLGAWLEMFDIAATATGDPDFALKAGASITIKHMGVLGPVLMNCSTLMDAALQLIRYIRVLGEFGQPKLEIHGDHAHLIWVWPYPAMPPAGLVQFMQAARAMNTRWMTARYDVPADAYFFFPRPKNVDVYKKVFGGKLFFDQPVNKLVVLASHLQLPIVTGSQDQRWLKAAEKEAQSVLKQLTSETALQQQIKKSLLGKLAIGRASLEEVAKEMQLNPRTLQRRLEAEDQSFRQILDEVRLVRAQNYLRDPKLSLAEIAFLLGYAEQSAFQYAFKQWTGQTPGDYRSVNL